MIVVDPGHVYKLFILDKNEHEVYSNLVFVKREGPKYPGNKTSYPGTNIQEVLRACFDRLNYLNKQVYDNRNERCQNLISLAIWLLECRAAERHKRSQPTLMEALVGNPLCFKCGHVGCKGECK